MLWICNFGYGLDTEIGMIIIPDTGMDTDIKSNIKLSMLAGRQYKVRVSHLCYRARTIKRKYYAITKAFDTATSRCLR